MAKQNKLQTRKAAPPLSAEEELAELLADPTLRPSLNFLGLENISTGTEPVSGALAGTDTPSGSDTAPVPLPAPRIYIKDTLDSSSPQTAHLSRSTDLPPVGSQIPNPVPDTLSVSDTKYERTTRSVPDTDSALALDTLPVAALDTLFEAEFAEDYYPRRPRHQRPTARRARTVEDGHSHAEQSLYSALWERGKPFNTDARVITMGFGAMSHLARLSLNNCRQNIRSLIHKLAVEEIRAEMCSEKIGKTYLIYNQPAILRRRRNAGLEWIIRTKGVVFVDPRTGAVLTDRSPAKTRPSPTSDTETVSESETVQRAR